MEFYRAAFDLAPMECQVDADVNWVSSLLWWIDMCTDRLPSTVDVGSCKRIPSLFSILVVSRCTDTF